MWIGDVGQTGINGVGQLLSGAVTPSGSLVDTYLYDNMANPAMYNFYTQAYPNAAEYNLLTEGADVQGMYSVYQEGIYLGYRYFETRYEDVVMGTAQRRRLRLGQDGCLSLRLRRQLHRFHLQQLQCHRV